MVSEARRGFVLLDDAAPTPGVGDRRPVRVASPASVNSGRGAKQDCLGTPAAPVAIIVLAQYTKYSEPKNTVEVSC